MDYFFLHYVCVRAWAWAWACVRWTLRHHGVFAAYFVEHVI